MRKTLGELELALNSLFDESMTLAVKTKSGELDIKKYSKKIVKNLFDCLISCIFYLSDKFMKIYLPDRLYHGTTTEFLPEIRENGLLPSETGKCWGKDSKKGIQKVCLTDCMYVAEYYAVIAAKKWGGKPIVLEIDVKDIKDKSQIRFELFKFRRPIDVYKEIYFTYSISQKRLCLFLSQLWFMNLEYRCWMNDFIERCRMFSFR